MATIARLEPLYIGTDYRYRFRVTNGDEPPAQLALDVSGWNLSFMAKKKVTDPDDKAIFEKHIGAGIVVDGAFDPDPAQNLQTIAVNIVDSDTDGLKEMESEYELKRMDAGFEGVIFRGVLPLVYSVHKA
jgi:hypothetical protein